MAERAALTAFPAPRRATPVADVRYEEAMTSPCEAWDADAPAEPMCPRIFHHHLYEYGRGVRALFLMTLTAAEAVPVAARLRGQGIAHFLQEVAANKVNLFFGRSAFVEAARAIVTRPLNTLTPEEDFMLGTLLGYDREQQCVRFLDRRARAADPGVMAAE